jgi:hypothetical protein
MNFKYVLVSFIYISPLAIPVYFGYVPPVKLVEAQVEKPVQAIVEPAKISTDELLVKYFGEVAPRAKKIITCESGGNPNAYHKNNNGSSDYGLMQINSIHIKRIGDLNKLYDPETNIRIGSEIYNEQGFRPWVCNKKI